jgi:ankyrin repeat protein
MKKFFGLMLVGSMLFISALANASIVDELNFVNDKSDFYSYINFSQILNFIGSRGIDINEFDAMVSDGSDTETDRVVKEFGLKLSDINEFMMVMNTRDLEKKSGYLVFVSFKNGKGIIPESFKKNSVKLKSGTAYKASAEDDVIFTKIDNFFVIGSTEYLESFLSNKTSKKSVLSGRGSLFVKKTSSKSIFFQITVSEFIKKAMNDAMDSGAGMARGLRENVFIQTLLSLESMDWGVEMNDKIIFESGMQGSKPEDSERLQMLCHTWIVGSSLVVSFADLMAAKSGDETLNELTADQRIMSWLQKAFGRIHVRRVDKGIITSFEMTPEETDIMISFVKKEMEKSKKERAEKLEREKISKLTLAVRENNQDNVQKFIKEKYNLNGLDSDGITPLGAAAVSGNVRIARILIENGAGIDTPDIDKFTPLHHAVKNGQKEMVTFLLSKGSDVNLKDSTEAAALHLNSTQGNSEITRILLAKGASINALDETSSTALHHASAAGFIEIVKVLVEKKADPELLNSSGQRPIDLASQNGHTEVVEFFKAKFKQEPESISYDDDSLNEDMETGDETVPADDGSGDPMLEEYIE